MTAAYLHGPPAPPCRKGIRHSCEGKAGFDSAVLAVAAASRLVGRTHYRCVFCGLFHVGRGRGDSSRLSRESEFLIKKEAKQ